MGTKVNSNYEDLISFVRASSSGRATALRPVSYGTELVTNGTYDTDLSGWATASGYASFTQSSGQATGTSNGSSAPQLNQSISTTVGSIYQVKYELVSSTSAGARFRVGTTDTGNQIFEEVVGTTTGARTKYIVATATTTYISIGYGPSTNGLTQTFDNVSVKKVLFDQPDGTLTLFEHPENVPRVEYDADGNRLGLLVEEQRTNLLRYSEDFENSYWDSISNATADNNTVTSPTGETNGATITATGSSYRAKIGIITTQNTTVTFSAFLKAGTQSIVGLHFADNLGDELNDNCDFDLSNGTVSSEGSSSTAKIQDMGNGWYRCSNTYTTNATGSTLAVRLATSSAGTYHVFGAQVEEASFPTSYIKNEGTSGGVTRSADVASIPVADFGYNYNKGTVLVEFQQDFEYGGTGFPRVFEIGDPSTERVNVYINENSGVLVAGANFNNATQAGLALKTETDGTVEATKVAYAFADDDFAASDDGDTVAIDTSGSFSGGTPRTKLLLGSSNFCGHIKSIKYYPRRLTNAQLQDLTS